MNMVVAGLEGCAVYLEDVVIFSDTRNAHVQRTTVNLVKCEFARATVTYLGRMVGQGQVRPIDAQVRAVVQFPAPAMKKEFMRFLGLVGYYQSFC